MNRNTRVLQRDRLCPCRNKLITKVRQTLAVTEQITRAGIDRAAAKGGQGFDGLRSKIALPVLFYFAAVMLPININLGSIYLTGVRIVLIVMIIPLTLRLMAGKYGKILLTDILFFLHFIWIIVALGVNNPDQVIQNAGATGIEFIGGYVLGRAYIRTAEDFAALVRTLAIIAFCTLPFALYETLTGHAIILNMLDKLPGSTSLRDLAIGKRMGLDRVQMVFTHPIHYGLFCSMALSLCFVGLRGLYSNGARWTISIVVAACGLLALSSGALLAIILQIGLISWAAIFAGTRKRWLFLLGLFAIAYVLIDILSNRTPIMVFLSYATFSASTAYWRTLIFSYGMENVWAHPLFGLGLNDWARPSWMRSGSMDNFWLVMAVRYGIPGWAFITGGYVLALWKIGRRDFDSDLVLWQFRRAWMFSFVGLTFTLTTVHVWHTLYSFVFFMFGAGMWMLSVQPKQIGAVPEAAPSPRGRPVPPQREATVPAEAAMTIEPQSVEKPSPYTRFQTRKDRVGKP